VSKKERNMTRLDESELDKILDYAIDPTVRGSMYRYVYNLSGDMSRVNNDECERMLYYCEYLKALGYIIFSKGYDVHNQEGVIISVKVTSAGFRYSLDGGFKGDRIRKGLEKKDIKNNQRITWVISVLAIAVSLGTLFASLSHNNQPIIAPTMSVDTVIIQKTLRVEPFSPKPEMTSDSQ
jgi:hypothetical protein